MEFQKEKEYLIPQIEKSVSNLEGVTFQVQEEKTLTVSGLAIALEERSVRVSGKRLNLTAKEFDTLVCLTSDLSRVFTKEQIYQQIYSEELIEGIDNIIYCLIRSLRKKLEPDPRHPKYIHTVRGVGYKFEVIPGE